MIHFGAPAWGFGLLILVLCGLLIVISLRRKQTDTRRLIQEELMRQVACGVNRRRDAWSALCLLCAAGLLFLSLARPQWGITQVEVKRKGHDIMFAVDISRSMLAQDLKPSRLERTKLSVGDFVDRLHADRVGLIAFTATAYLACPLTTDAAAFQMVLDSLEPGSTSDAGTSLAAAIHEAIRATEEGSDSQDRLLILISDGEDHQGGALDAARKAKEKNIRISCVGIGTPEGELITLTDAQGRSGYLKNKEGQVVLSRLNEELLRNIAREADGFYVRSTPTDFGIRRVYEDSTRNLERREFKTEIVRRFQERFQIFLALALIFLLGELWITRGERR